MGGEGRGGEGRGKPYSCELSTRSHLPSGAHVGRCYHVAAEVTTQVVARDTGLGEGRGRGLGDGAVGVSHHHERVKPKSGIHTELRGGEIAIWSLFHTHTYIHTHILNSSFAHKSVKCEVQTCHIAVVGHFASPFHAPCT